MGKEIKRELSKTSKKKKECAKENCQPKRQVLRNLLSALQRGQMRGKGPTGGVGLRLYRV